MALLDSRHDGGCSPYAYVDRGPQLTVRNRRTS